MLSRYKTHDMLVSSLWYHEMESSCVRNSYFLSVLVGFSLVQSFSLGRTKLLKISGSSISAFLVIRKLCQHHYLDKFVGSLFANFA